MAVYVVPDKNPQSDMTQIGEYPANSNKVFTTEYNQLNGTFYPMADSGYPGWWGATPSNGTTGVPVDGRLQIQYSSVNRCHDMGLWTLQSGITSIDNNQTAHVVGSSTTAAVSPQMNTSNLSSKIHFSVELCSDDGITGYSIQLQRKSSVGGNLGAPSTFTGTMGDGVFTRVSFSITVPSTMYGCTITVQSISGTTSQNFRIRRPMLLTMTASESLYEGRPEIFEAFLGTQPAEPITPISGQSAYAGGFVWVGDPGLGVYPVDYTLKAYYHGELLYTENVVGNASAFGVITYPYRSYSISHIVLDITKMSNPGSTMKMQFLSSATTIWSADLLKPVISDDGQPTVNITRADILKPKIAETDLQTVTTHPSEIVALNTADTAFLPYVEKYVTDTASIQATSSIGLTNSFTRSDTLTPKIVDTKAITVSFTRADTLIPRGNIEAEIFTAYLTRPEVLKVNISDTKQLFNIYNSMTADQRYVLGRVEITYTDPFADETLSITTSEPGTGETALYNNITETPYKTFSLHRNTLDGTFHPRDLDNPLGWWGTQLSNGSGAFTTPVTVTLNFSLRTIGSLRVSGDSALNEYPVDFDYVVLNEAGVGVYTESVVGNTSVHWEKVITPIPLAKAIKLKVYKINQPNAVVKLAEMFTMVVQTYESDNIESIHLIDEIGYANGSLPIGNISANEVDVILDNQDRRFDPNNKNSPLYGFVKRNRRIRVWFGAYVDTILEWTLMGTYWSVSWDVASSALTATVVGRDRLELLRQAEYNTSIVRTNKTLYQAFYDLFIAAGLTVDDFEIDSTLASLTIPHTWYDRGSFRDALQHLASCDIIQVYCTKDGKIKVNWDLDATTNVMARYSEDTNIFTTKHPMAVGEQVNSISVTYTVHKIQLGDPEVLHEYVTPITIPANSTLLLDIDFSQTPATQVTSINLTAAAGISVQSHSDYAWGSSVLLSNTAGTAGLVSGMVFNGHVLKETEKVSVTAEDAQSIKDYGRLQVTVEHPFIQTRAHAESLASRILAAYKEGRQDIVMSDRGNVAVRLGDRVEVEENGEITTYVITRQDLTWDGALSGTTEGKYLQ